MDSRNVSFAFNNLRWGDGILAGLGGSAASVNMTDRLDTALPIIQSNPQRFDASFLMNELEPTLEEPEENKGWQIRERILSILQGRAGIVKDDVDFLPDWKTVGKYVLLAILALILVWIGLQILLWPAEKQVIKLVKDAQ